MSEGARLLEDAPASHSGAALGASLAPFMYPDRFRLPFLTGVLIAAAERRRPGLGPWSFQVEEQLRQAFDSELEDVRRSFLESFDDPGWFARVEEKIEEIALPRYLVEAKRETDLEQRGYGLWRGGDLLSRVVLALGGLCVGAFLVKAPFIPIPTTWDLLIFAMGLAAPLLPDLQIALHRRRHRRALQAIVEDLQDAEAKLELYQPLSSPETSAPALPAGRESVRQKG
ncbi:MAG TPA: hypothetical protein VLT82_18950 [Myxococcaceae bacterium]|nr:hypothetical protein [Myxococcaceae bacterium]